jgi:hypothetical protein
MTLAAPASIAAPTVSGCWHRQQARKRDLLSARDEAAKRAYLADRFHGAVSPEAADSRQKIVHGSVIGTGLLLCE